MNTTTPTGANVLVLKPMLKLIPRRLITRHALESGVEAKARSFSVVRWQVYTALQIYALRRHMAYLSAWGRRFTRRFAVTRSALWERIDLLAVLKAYGAASGRFKVIGALNPAWLPGFAPIRT